METKGWIGEHENEFNYYFDFVVMMDVKKLNFKKIILLQVLCFILIYAFPSNI